MRVQPIFRDSFSIGSNGEAIESRGSALLKVTGRERRDLIVSHVEAFAVDVEFFFCAIVRARDFVAIDPMEIVAQSSRFGWTVCMATGSA